MRILHLNYVPAALPMLVRSFEIARAVSELGHDVTLAYMARRFAPADGFVEILRSAASSSFRVLHARPPESDARAPGAAAGRRGDGRGVARATLHGLVRQIAGSLSYIPAELRLLARERPDVLIARPDHVISFPLTARLRDVPLVLETDGPVEELDHYWGVPSRWIRPIDTLRARSAHGLLTVSDLCSELWRRKGFPADRLFPCPNGADPNAFRPCPARRVEVRRTLGIDGSVVVGFSGNQRCWHGVDRLLQGMIPITRDAPDVRVLIIGALVEADRLRLDALPAALRRRVVFTGTVPYGEMPALIDAADVMAMPYPALPMFHFSPMKMFEALAMAKPIVASRQGQVATVLDEVASAYLYDPGDSGGLERQLTRAIASVRRGEDGAAGRRVLCDRHTWSHRARVVVEACHRALDGTVSVGTGHGA